MSTIIKIRRICAKSGARIGLDISTQSKEKNKRFFNQLLKNREHIEKSFGEKLEWWELPDKKMSSIVASLSEVSVYNEQDWDAMNEFLTSRLPRFETAFRPYVDALK